MYREFEEPQSGSEQELVREDRQACDKQSPGLLGYFCLREHGHDGTHKAFSEQRFPGRYYAEWDDDRSTDEFRGRE